MARERSPGSFPPTAASARRLTPSGGFAGGFLLALGLGAIGGYIFYILNLPLPWMLGAMSLVTIAALSGVPLVTWPSFRNAMVATASCLVKNTFPTSRHTKIQL